MILFLLVLASMILIATGIWVDRRFRRRIDALSERLDRYVERIETFSNYSKLAAVRIAEGEQARDQLAAELDKLIAEHRALSERITEASNTAPSEFHVFDRLDNRKDKLFEFVIESTADGTDWTGRRHYIVAAATPELAAERVGARFPKMAGFRISAPIERKSF